MLDGSLLAKAMLLGAATAAGVLLAVACLGRARGRGWLSAGWVIGVAAGVYAGCMVLDQCPRWPPREDRDRFLTVVLPLAVCLEILAATRKSRWGPWLARAILAASLAPILLYNTVYLADLRGPDSAEWSLLEATGLLSFLAVGLLGVWALAAWLQVRTHDRASPMALALVSLAAGITVMLSGYYRGGLLGLPLAAAIVGAMLAAWRFGSPPDEPFPYLGIGLVGIFTLLVIGYFFGSLPASSAICLLLSPLMAWFAELPAVRRMPKPVLQCARVVLVAGPLMLIVLLAKWRFDEASLNRSHSSPSPSQSALLDN